ncbi:MAG: sugar phosphate isomerase/epimerase [Methanomassiliicoccaceae archaeon]|jgi:hypothetical protein|nr:sugar phosphate isomerase/epimerase [Methanomassiliicoccaceae archaeon]
MRHLFSISAYDFDINEYGGASEAVRRMKEAGADGAELLTGYFDPDPVIGSFAEGIHLPYATDWYSAWSGDTGYIDMVSDENIRYRSYGRSREDMVITLREAMIHASSVSPAYGVLHASNTRMDEVMGFAYRDKDEDVLHALADLMNRAVSSFDGGEPPFRIVFENIWWPGLRMTDDSGYDTLLGSLDFDNWGLCLDTGHLMNCLAGCRYEEESIDDVLRIIGSYPQEMRGRIDVVHLHMSLSAEYRDECITRPKTYDVTNDDEMISKAYEHVCKIDQHRPFSSRRCTEIVDALNPEYVTHEISAPTSTERLSGFSGQRSLFLAKR